MEPTGYNDEMIHLVNHIIKVNEIIQSIIWKSGLLHEYEIYMAFRESLLTPNLKGILDALWCKVNENGNDRYKFLVLEFIKEYANLVVRKM